MKNVKNIGEDCFEDFRGKIYFFVIEGVKFHITATKMGMLRGGDYHPSIQRDMVLKGRIEVTIHRNGQDEIKEYGPNDLIEIPSHLPHLFKSLTDSLMIEWRDDEYKSEYFAPYKKQIDEQSKKFNQ